MMKQQPAIPDTVIIPAPTIQRIRRLASWTGALPSIFAFVILPKDRDPCFITIRRGGTLTERAGRRECRWQREQLPDVIRELVLDGERLRNSICWSVFDC
jgi:hypothetical protein